MRYNEWTQAVTDSLVELYGDSWRVHGGPSTLPPNAAVGSLSSFAGQPAARYDNETYTELANAGQIDLTLPQVASPSGNFVYVVAPKLDDVPATMSAWDRFLNAGFTTADRTADAIGLPSLNTLENMLKGAGLVALGVGALVVWSMFGRPSRR